jgi:excisionase family DNA binding protein
LISCGRFPRNWIAFPMQTETETLLTVTQAAKLAQVAPNTVRSWINRPVNPLPAQRPGYRTVRLDRETFLEWLKEQR